MIKVKFAASDEFGQNKQNVEYLLNDSWPEQVDAFFDFLKAQGYIITYGSFLSAFGDAVKEYDDCFKTEKGSE